MDRMSIETARERQFSFRRTPNAGSHSMTGPERRCAQDSKCHILELALWGS
jgi:hypothetical protein